MQIRDLFTVPKGQKITERHLRRVLISSICSILLCMTCLVGSTWAWFTVSIENTGNRIGIGKPEVNLTVDGECLSAGISLAKGTHKIQIEHANEMDDLQKKSTLYVTLTVQSGDEVITGYVVLNEENQYGTELNVEANKDCVFNWEVSWFAPANATALTGDTIVVEADIPEEESTAPSAESGEVPDESEEFVSEPTTETVTEDSESESDPTDVMDAESQ